MKHIRYINTFITHIFTHLKYANFFIIKYKTWKIFNGIVSNAKRKILSYRFSRLNQYITDWIPLEMWRDIESSLFRRITPQSVELMYYRLHRLNGCLFDVLYPKIFYSIQHYWCSMVPTRIVCTKYFSHFQVDALTKVERSFRLSLVFKFPSSNYN